MAVMRHKEAIHSGHFMVSDFEADDVAEEDEVDYPMQAPGSASSADRDADPTARMLGSAGSCNDIRRSGSPAIAKMREAEASDALAMSTKSGRPPDLSQELEDRRVVIGTPIQDMIAVETKPVGAGAFAMETRPNVRDFIDISLKKLFQRMSIAYRHKFTSPKWNKFRGLHLRWKDRIRLNNVIWRCWHLQFIKHQVGRQLLCAFANPLEIDNHNRTEGGTLLEGKYWKRKMETIKTEYIRWRMFYKNRCEAAGEDFEDADRAMEQLFRQEPFQLLEGSKDDAALSDLMLDNDDFIMEALFGSTSGINGFGGGSNSGAGGGAVGMAGMPSTSGLGVSSCSSEVSAATVMSGERSLSISGHPMAQSMPNPPQSSRVAGATLSVPFPKTNTREVVRGTTNSDFIQPGLVQLQPNLEDILAMDLDHSDSSMPAWSQQDSQHAPQEFAPGGALAMTTGQPAPKSASPHGQRRASFSSFLGVFSSPAPLPMTADQGQVTPPVSAMMPMDQQGVTVQNCVVGYPVPQRQSQSPDQQMYDLAVAAGGKVRETETVQQEPPTTFSSTFTMSTKKSNNSPKHRILRHRDYASGETGVYPPYKLPQSPTVRPPPPATSPASASSYLLEQRIQTRSQAAAKSTGGGDSGVSPTSVTGSNSELLQLLKVNKAGSINAAARFEPPDASTSIRGPTQASKVDPDFSPQPKFAMRESPSSSPVAFNLSSERAPPTYAPGNRSPPAQHRNHQGFRGRTDTTQYVEHRRNVHTNAEQRRRGSLKNGFEQMRALIPSLRDNANAKISKAALLHKGGEHLQQLKADRANLAEEISRLKRESELLNGQLEVCQSSLSSNSPGSAASTLAASQEALDRHFDQHVRVRTVQNWRYWTFSLLMRPLLLSFNNAVGLPESFDELDRTARSWVNQHMRLVQLRPVVLRSLREFAIESEVLSNPERLQEEAMRAVTTTGPLKLRRKSRAMNTDYPGTKYDPDGDDMEQ